MADQTPPGFEALAPGHSGGWGWGWLTQWERPQPTVSTCFHSSGAAPSLPFPGVHSSALPESYSPLPALQQILFCCKLAGDGLSPTTEEPWPASC